MAPVPVARCSFCFKPDTAVGTLVAGPGVFICNECVALSSTILAGRPARSGNGAPRLAPWEHDRPVDEVLAQLAPVAAAGAQVEDNLRGWVGKARSLGASWGQIGAALDMTRQSAWERFAADEQD